MIKFSAAQTAQLDQRATQREAARLAPIMRRNFDAQLREVTAADLLARIERALNAVTTAGVTERRAVTAFVILALLIGEGFHEQANMAPIMNCGVPRTIELALVAMLAELKWQLSKLEDR